MQLPAKMHLDMAVDVNYIIVSKVALFQVGNTEILIGAKGKKTVAVY